MRFATYIANGQPGVAEVDDDRLVPLAGISEIGVDTPLDRLLGAKRLSNAALRVSDVTLRCVVPHPTKIFCVGLNYASHVQESKRDTPSYPVLFAKFDTSLIGPDDPITTPPEAAQVDWEGELAVVIGRRGRRIPESDALDYVLGYVPANDVTMRDYQYRTHQWIQGKAWDASTPVGPYLATADELDLDHAEIKTILNGETVQHSDLSRLMFPVPVLIARISEFVELRPGDMILTGTPSGVGYRRDPQIFLTDGDTIEVHVAGLTPLISHVRGSVSPAAATTEMEKNIA